MSRYARQTRYAPQDTTAPSTIYEGDKEFLGLNCKSDPDELDPGYYARGENIRANRKVVEKRAGNILPMYANHVPFPENILGSGSYKNPRGPELMLIFTPTVVYRIGSGSPPIAIPLPSGTTLSGRVYPVQAFDKVLLGRGLDDPPLQWDGLTTTGFKEIKKSSPDDTTRIIIPNFSRGVVMKSRFMVPVGRTNIALSDILDYTQYDKVFSNFPANLGTSDTIVRLFPYANNSLIIGKEHRLELLTNYLDPNHPEAARLEELNTEIGTCAWDSWAMVGGDAWFLSADGGVFRVLQVVQDRLEASAEPVSDKVDPLIKRINWNYAHLAVSATQGIYYKLAVPFDGSTVNNAIFNFNTVTKECEGVDLFDPAAGMQVDNLLVFPHNGARRCFAINHALKSIHLLDEGKYDEVPGGRYEIKQIFRSRGYATIGSNGASRRDFKRVDIAVRTWRPSIQVSELTEHAADARLLTSGGAITKSPVKYDIWGVPDYVPTNVNHDHTEPGREDYSVTWPANPATGIDFEAPGVDIERKQDDTLPFSTKVRGRFVQVELENAQGDCDVTGILLESDGVQRTTRRAA